MKRAAWQCYDVSLYIIRLLVLYLYQVGLSGPQAVALHRHTTAASHCPEQPKARSTKSHCGVKCRAQDILAGIPGSSLVPFLSGHAAPLGSCCRIREDQAHRVKCQWFAVKEDLGPSSDLPVKTFLLPVFPVLFLKKGMWDTLPPSCWLSKSPAQQQAGWKADLHPVVNDFFFFLFFC